MRRMHCRCKCVEMWVCQVPVSNVHSVPKNPGLLWSIMAFLICGAETF